MRTEPGRAAKLRHRGGGKEEPVKIDEAKENLGNI